MPNIFPYCLRQISYIERSRGIESTVVVKGPGYAKVYLLPSQSD